MFCKVPCHDRQIVCVFDCRVSMVTQRLVHVERKLRIEAEALAAEKAEEAERLKGELTVLQVGLHCYAWRCA